LTVPNVNPGFNDVSSFPDKVSDDRMEGWDENNDCECATPCSNELG
jgi:hypothetical protein